MNAKAGLVGSKPLNTAAMPVMPATILTPVLPQMLVPPAALQQASVASMKPAKVPLTKKEVNLTSSDSTATKLTIERVVLEKPRPIAFDRQRLEALNFYYEKPGNTPLLQLILNKRPEFRLSKTATKSYTLKIPDCTLKGEYLRLPQFPPQDFSGFSLVLAETKGADLHITIGVERGVKINAFSRGNQILIRAIH